MKEIIIVGSGGHVRSLLEIVDIHSLPIAGYASLTQVPDINIPYLGDDEYVLKHYSPDDFAIILGVVYLDKVDMIFRRSLLDKYSMFEGYSIVARSSVVTSHTELGSGTVVFEQALINRSVLGQHCIVNSGAIIEHDCIIGDNVFIGSGCIIAGGVSIGSNSFIGSGSMIKDGIKITANTIVGMGGLVVKDIHEAGLYCGQPVIRK